MLNPHIESKPNCTEDWEYDLDAEETENAAWEFIADHGRKSAKRIINGKISVSCPNAVAHKHGRDRNMSAFIKVDKGLVWCSACSTKVG